MRSQNIASSSTVRSKKRGFTLVEIMITIVIIGLLAAMTGLGLSWVRDRSRKKVCVAQLDRLWEAKRAAWNYFEDLSTRSDPDSDIIKYLDQDALMFCPTPGTHQPSPGTKPTVTNFTASYELSATAKDTRPSCKITATHIHDNE